MMSLFDTDVTSSYPQQPSLAVADGGFFASPNDSLAFDDVALWFITQHSLTSMRILANTYANASDALAASTADWSHLGVHATHLKRREQWDKGSALRKNFENTVNDIIQKRLFLIRMHDVNYPQPLKNISDPPPFLFVCGAPHILFQPQVSVVGSRKPSPTGKKIAQHFAKTLAEQGLWITSGLAHGIDAESHLGALSAGGGRTIAVLGTGVMQCYPESNQSLYQRIVAEGGAVVSEFIPCTPPLAHHFPRRNRIVSGMSLGVLVVEAAVQSGSLITARLGAEQGKLVFAVPGHIHNTQAHGCHQLIREGAILVDNPAQILEDLNLPRRWHANNSTESSIAEETAEMPKPLSPESMNDRMHLPDIPVHLQALLTYLDWTGASMDSIIENSRLDVALVSGQLMELELLGLVIQNNGLYQRCRV